MRIDVLTLFPPAFDAGPLDVSIIKRAREDGLLELAVHDIREHATDKHRSVDDYPFGGGQGMVMRVDVLARDLAHVRHSMATRDRGFLSPQGERLDEALVRDLAKTLALSLSAGLRGSTNASSNTGRPRSPAGTTRHRGELRRWC